MKHAVNTPEPFDNLRLFHRWLDELAAECFWGVIVLTLQNGGIIHARREESLRPHQIAKEVFGDEADKIGKQVTCEPNPKGVHGAGHALR